MLKAIASKSPRIQKTGGYAGLGRFRIKKGNLLLSNKLAGEIGRRLEKRYSEVPPKPGHHVLDFHVITDVVVDKGEIRVTHVTVQPPTQAEPAEKPAQFDPEEAGRNVVKQLQEMEGGAWTGSELARHFGLTAAALHKRRKEYRIVFWRDAKHQFHYPKWQFTPTGAILPGVQEVAQIFRSSDEWRVMRYFLAPRHQLDGQAPLQLLRAGEVTKVVAHAKAQGEENSW